MPKFVKDEFDAYLECGILAHGFLRLRCTNSNCSHEKLLAFSCKKRVLVGSFFVFLSVDDMDLLSTRKNHTVILKNDTEFIDERKHRLILPEGTKLKFISQYEHEGTFSLNLIIDNLSSVEESKGKSFYFSKEIIQLVD